MMVKFIRDLIANSKLKEAERLDRQANVCTARAIRLRHEASELISVTDDLIKAEREASP